MTNQILEENASISKTDDPRKDINITANQQPKIGDDITVETMNDEINDEEKTGDKKNVEMTDIKKTDTVAEEKKSDTTNGDNIEKKSNEIKIAGSFNTANSQDLKTSKTELLNGN